MSWFTKWSFKNKAAVSIMTMIILVMGVLSYFRLPMEFLPSADQPFINVVVIGQGIDSKSMEKQVTTPIEEAVGSIKGKKIFSLRQVMDIHRLKSILSQKRIKKKRKEKLKRPLIMWHYHQM